MLQLSTDELKETLKQLEYAIHWHEEWLAATIRTVAARLPYDDRDVGAEAHRQCRFGQWYYGHAPETLKKHPSFVAIGEEHEHMHKKAARLLIDTKRELVVSPMDYDGFMNVTDSLRLEINTLKHEIEESIYNRDALTGAENRIGMLIKLREMREMALRKISKSAIVMVDLDHFKAVNDKYGHAVGDQVLAAIVQRIKQNLRPYDVVFRYGGEEFLISLPDTDLDTATAVINRIGAAIAALPINTTAPEPIFITVSSGVASLDPDVSVEESINRADSALYEAKKAGRNRGVIWDPSMTAT